MLNGVSAFWAIFSLTAILFGFQNCSPSNVGVNELVANTNLSSLLNEGNVTDTGYYGGQNFKFSETENGQTLQELNVLKTDDMTVSLSVEERTTNCNIEKDKAGLKSLDFLIKFSDIVRVTHPQMLTELNQICSDLDASIKRQHIEIGNESKTFLVTKDGNLNCLMDDPYEILNSGNRVFVVSNLDHYEILSIIEKAEKASETSEACTSL